jgi:hypothetical protein
MRGVSMYQVLENERPAEYPTTVLWKNSKFNLFENAVSYAQDWLGVYDPGNSYKWELNKPFYFNEGRYITIILRIEVSEELKEREE